MIKSSKPLSLMQKISTYLGSEEALQSGRKHKQNFTRKRKLGLGVIIGMLLNSLTRSLQIELDDFFEYVLASEETVTKQAFSKARQNVKPEFLKELLTLPTEILYSDEDFKTHGGYRLLAIDGTTLELPDFAHLRKHFRDVGNKAKTVRAKASALFDVENGMILAAEIDHYRVDERTFARRHLVQLKESGYKHDLVLYDRGYPSRELLAYHKSEGLDFLMRAKNSFLDRKRVYAGELDYMKTFTFRGKEYCVRRIAFQLDSGEVETLITSLPTSVTLDEIKQIYAKRWGIETEFYSLKHKIEIENFSGYTVTAILQDYYASICLSNIAAIFALEASNISIATRKYTYKPNENILIGKLKNRLSKALLSRNDAAICLLIDKILGSIARNLVPVRPNRIVPRESIKRSLKYPPNQKRAV